MEKFETKIPESIARKICDFYNNNLSHGRILTISTINFLLSQGAVCTITRDIDTITSISIYFILQDVNGFIKTVISSNTRDTPVLRTPVSVKSLNSTSSESSSDQFDRFAYRSPSTVSSKPPLNSNLSSSSMRRYGKRFRFVIYEKSVCTEKVLYPEKTIDREVSLQCKDSKQTIDIPIYVSLATNFKENYYEWEEKNYGQYFLHRNRDIIAKVMVCFNGYINGKLKLSINVMQLILEDETELSEVLFALPALAQKLGAAEIRIPMLSEKTSHLLENLPVMNHMTATSCGFEQADVCKISSETDDIRLPWLLF